MRILLDEHLPVRLARELGDHEVSTVRAEGWSGTKNGVVLGVAADAGFDVFVTNDSSIEFQLNLAEVHLGVVMLDARTNKFEDLLPLVPAVLEAISAVRPGEVRHVSG